MSATVFRFFSVLCFALATTSAQAAVCTSIRNGNWSTASSWSCDSWAVSRPGAGDWAIVNHSIGLNTDTATLAGLIVSTGAQLSDNGNNRTINLNGLLSVWGSLLLDGNGADLVLWGNSTWSGDGTFVLDHIEQNWHVLTLSNGAALTIELRSSDPIRSVAGFNNGTTPNSTATVHLNGGSQTINQNNLQFPNLWVSGGTKTVPGGSELNILGALTIDAGAGFSSTNGINLGGDLTINGTLSPGDGPWTFNGSTTQTVSAAASFRRVTVDNPQGIALGGDLTIGDSSWGDLTLTVGRISTGAFSVVIPRPCSAAWLASRAVGAWIDGSLRLTAPGYGATCFFPVGDASNFSPITFTYPWHQAPLGGTLTGRTMPGDHPDTTAGSSGIRADKSVNRYWSLTPGAGATFYTYDATFQFCIGGGSADCTVNDVDSAATPANFIVAEKAGGAWSASTPTSPTAASRFLGGLTTFGAFAIGEAGSATSLTCINDSFAGGLDSSRWNVSGTGFTPLVVSSPTSRLRLTDNSSNRSTMAQLKKWFPGANNKVVIEFDYYAYGGSGADGIAIVLSDAGKPPAPGGYGGSLGYANRSGINGFNGGWLGIGLDEFGNYPNSSEGRHGYPSGYTPPVGANAAAGSYRNSVAVRGSGNGQNGYALLANTGVLSPALTTTNAAPHRYRVTMDHSNSINAMVSVERNTGSGYVTLVPPFDIKVPSSGQAAVPTDMLLSFTGSTGGSTNFHEISNISVCATRMTDPGGSSDAANFECIETASLPTWSSTVRHPLYTKLTDTDFKFDIVALKSDGSIEDQFVAAGGDAKNVTVELFNDALSPAPASCAAYTSPVATQTLTYISGDGGRKTLTGNFKLAKAWGKLRCRVSDANAAPTVYGCSSDTFTVRPQAFSSLTSNANGDNAGASAATTTVIKAGAAFTLTAGTGKVGYDGTPKIDASRVEWPNAPTGVGTVAGVFTTPAGAASGDGATGAAFSYSEVGYFRFKAYGVYDDTFSAQSGDTTDQDCSDDFSNTLVDGKYGCKFGNLQASDHFGRFIPDHFRVTDTAFAPACNAGGYSYMDQAFATNLSATVEAQNSSDTRTQNYAGDFANGVVGVQLENANSGVPVAANRLNAVGAPAWSAGRYTFSADRFLRLTTGPDGPFDALAVGLSVADELSLATAKRPYLILRDMDVASTGCTTDTTGLATSADICTATTVLAATRVRFGRLWLGNAYGSERQALSLPYETQFWNGLAFVRNALDNCTALTNANVGLGNHQGAVTQATLPVDAVSQGAFAAGAGSVRLAAPNAAGSVDVVARLDPALSMCPGWGPVYPGGTPASLAFLRGRWCDAAFDKDAVARATFGIARSNRQIYLREGF